MSKSEPAATEDRTPDSHDPNKLELESDHIPLDPLLDFDSFIENGDQNGRTDTEQPKPSEPEEEQPKPLESENSNPKPKRARKNIEVAAPERPDWLPESWRIELRIRSSGATAGSFDRYYIEPVAGRRFRSKKEVIHFLETGSKRKKPPPQADNNMPSESSGTPKQKRSRAKTKTPATFSFDFKNPPEKVSWFLTNPSDDRWSPSIGDGNLPESTKQEWSAVFDSICRS